MLVNAEGKKSKLITTKIRDISPYNTNQNPPGM